MGFKYQYALTSVPFDNSYENVLRFDTRAQQEEYFGVSTLFSNAPFINFDFGDLLSTTLTIRLDGSPLRTLGYNYLIIKNTNDNASPAFIYYFVNNVEYLTGGDDDNKVQAVLYLTLDIFNTYLLDADFGDGAMIRRASLDRWVKTSYGHYILNFALDSPFRLQDENVEVQHDLIIKKRSSVSIQATSDKASTALNWLNQNVAGWLYVFLDSNHEYVAPGFKAYQTTADSFYVKNTNDQKLQKDCLQNILYFSAQSHLIPDYGSICVPIYKTNKRIICRCSFQNTQYNYYLFPQFIVDDTGLNEFREKNNDASYFFTEKASVLPPWFNLSNIHSEITTDGHLVIVLGYNSVSSSKYLGTTLDGKDNAVYGALQDSDNIYSYAMMTTIVTTNGDVNSNGGHIYYRKTKPTSTEINNNADKYFDNLPHGVFVGLTQHFYETTSTSKYFLPYDTYAQSNEIINGNKKKQWCPALYNSNYATISIQCNGASVDYGLSEFYTTNEKEQGDPITFLYTEVLQPEITKFYIRPNAPVGIYQDTAYNNNFSGIVSTCDLSVALVNSAYAEFLANNKNYWLQAFASSIGGSGYGSIFSDLKRNEPVNIQTSSSYSRTHKHRFKGENLRLKDKIINSKSYSKTISGGQSSIGNLWLDVAKMGIDMGVSLVNAGLQLDNLKASPSNMVNSTGNTFFALATSGFGVWLDFYELTDLDKQRVYDYYYEFGYPLNTIGKVDDYINIRHYFNYLQADVPTITGKNGVNIPNSVRDALKNTLNEGVRFWNITDKIFEYDMENYERSIE